MTVTNGIEKYTEIEPTAENMTFLEDEIKDMQNKIDTLLSNGGPISRHRAEYLRFIRDISQVSKDRIELILNYNDSKKGEQ